MQDEPSRRGCKKSFSQMREEAEKENTHHGTQAMGQAPYTPNDRKTNCSLYFVD